MSQKKSIEFELNQLVYDFVTLKMEETIGKPGTYVRHCAKEYETMMAQQTVPQQDMSQIITTQWNVVKLISLDYGKATTQMDQTFVDYVTDSEYELSFSRGYKAGNVYCAMFQYPVQKVFLECKLKKQYSNKLLGVINDSLDYIEMNEMKELFFKTIPQVPHVQVYGIACLHGYADFLHFLYNKQ